MCIRDRGERIFLTLDTHGPDYLDTQEGRLLPAPHCIRDTPGWKLNAQVEEAAGPQAQRVEKGSFGSPKLARILAALCQDKGLDEGTGMEKMCIRDRYWFAVSLPSSAPTPPGAAGRGRPRPCLLYTSMPSSTRSAA